MPFRQALRQFRSHLLQSLLIVVAVALGVGVVVAVAAFLSLNRTLEQQAAMSLKAREIQLAQSGATNLFSDSPDFVEVRPLGPTANEPTPVLTLKDLALAKAAAPAVDYAYVFEPRGLGGARESLDYAAVTADYLRAAKVKLSAGSLFTQSDFAEGRSVALVVPSLLKRFNVQGNPVGQAVSFIGHIFTITGVLAPRNDLDTYAAKMIVPYTPAKYHKGVHALRFAVKDPTDLDEARAQLAAFAHKRWGSQVSVVVNMPSPTLISRQHLADLIIALFASAALLVAALGIMNLMLARARTRQRDIGIRRSLGATRANVYGQFLSESLVLGLLGSLLGLAVAEGFLAVLNSYRPADLPALTLAWQTTLLGIVLALVLSLLFGFYPAWRASRARIVDTLGEF